MPVPKIFMTPERLDAGMSRNGQWSHTQLRALGVDRVKGWRRRLMGTVVTVRQYEEFLRLKDKHLQRSLRRASSSLKEKAGA